MAVPVFKGEFTMVEVVPALTPEWPKMQGNRLLQEQDGWRLEMVVRYPSGKPKYASIMIPGQQEDLARTYLASEGFWKEMWETLIICMQGEGEGLGVKMPGTRH